MCRLFPCASIFRGFFWLKSLKKMCMFVGVKNHIDTCKKCMFWCEKRYKWILALGSPKAYCLRSCAFKIWYCKTQHMHFFLPFGFIHVIVFVINPCEPYARFIGVESCVKVCFESFGPILTNLQSISY